MARGRQKRVVNGRRNEHGTAGLRHGTGGQVESRDHAGYPDQPLLGNFPAVLAFEPAQERFHHVLRRARVPQHRVLETLRDGRPDEGRHGEVHVRHPEGQDVPSSVLVPFRARRVGAIDLHIELARFPVRRHDPSVHRSAPGMARHPARCRAAGSEGRMSAILSKRNSH